MTTIDIFFSYTGTWFLRIFSWHGSLWLHNSNSDLVWLCTDSFIQLLHSGVGDQSKAPEMFGVWMSQHSTVGERRSPVLKTLLSFVGCFETQLIIDELARLLKAGRWEPATMIPLPHQWAYRSKPMSTLASLLFVSLCHTAWTSPGNIFVLNKRGNKWQIVSKEGTLFFVFLFRIFILTSFFLFPFICIYQCTK